MQATRHRRRAQRLRRRVPPAARQLGVQPLPKGSTGAQRRFPLQSQLSWCAEFSRAWNCSRSLRSLWFGFHFPYVAILGARFPTKTFRCCLLACLIPGSGDCCSNDLAVRGGQLLRAEFEGQLVELAREAEGHLVVLVVYSGAGVHADVEGLVSWQQERDRLGIVRVATPCRPPSAHQCRPWQCRALHR